MSTIYVYFEGIDDLICLFSHLLGMIGASYKNDT